MDTVQTTLMDLGFNELSEPPDGTADGSYCLADPNDGKAISAIRCSFRSWRHGLDYLFAFHNSANNRRLHSGRPLTQRAAGHAARRACR
jgi:hypothetical protein